MFTKAQTGDKKIVLNDYSNIIHEVTRKHWRNCLTSAFFKPKIYVRLYDSVDGTRPQCGISEGNEMYFKVFGFRLDSTR